MPTPTLADRLTAAAPELEALFLTMEAARERHVSLGMADTSNLPTSERLAADLEYHRATRERNRTEDAYRAALDAFEQVQS